MARHPRSHREKRVVATVAIAYVAAVVAGLSLAIAALVKLITH